MATTEMNCLASGGGIPNLSLIYAESQPQPTNANNFSYTFDSDYDYVEVVYFNGNSASHVANITFTGTAITNRTVNMVCEKQTVGGPATAIGTNQLWIAQIWGVKSGDTLTGVAESPYYGALYIYGY